MRARVPRAIRQGPSRAGGVPIGDWRGVAPALAGAMTTRPPVLIWSAAPEVLVELAREAGWTARVGNHAEAGAITVVDARGAIEAGCAVLADNTEAAARIALVGDVAPAQQDALIAAGASQIAVIGEAGQGFVQALRLALPLASDRRGRAAGASAIEAWIAGRLGAHQPVAVIHVAVVRLDLVNAAHGRDAGTALIEAAERRIAAQVAAVAEDDGMVARTAGAALVAAIALPADRVVVAAARIEEALARPFRQGGGEAVLGTRIGLAVAHQREEAAALLSRAAAETAPETTPALVDPLAVDIHLALARGEITILFQPQGATETGAVVGVEALARWQHPDQGCLGAEALFAAASRAGVSIALSDHIHRTVLDRIAGWPAALGGLRVAINLTAADLARPGFVETLLGHIDASGVARGRLTLEITETELIDDLDAAAAALAALRSAGCRTAIDDFGTGYSSLAYLAALPIDYLKLDRSLAQEIVGPRRRQVVARAAIDMARSLGIAVIAEGVEEEAQRVTLADSGCALYQGFLLAPPLHEDALVAMIEGGME